MPKRVALLIANGKYRDANITQLNAPTNDTEALQRLLLEKKYGNFDSVIRLTNKTSSTIRKEISRLYKESGSEDLVLLYLSGHGVRYDNEFYFLTNDTDTSNIEGTSLDASYIWQRFNKSYSRKRVIILDTCNSGAFAEGMKSLSLGGDAGISDSIKPESKGYIVLMSSDSLQAAFEGKKVEGMPHHSIFTQHLLNGIESGDADINNDGRIDTEELFHYIREKMMRESQNPKIRMETDGPLYIAGVPGLSFNPKKIKYGVSVVSLSAINITRLDGRTSDLLHNELVNLNNSGEYRIVIDFLGVDYISSSGLMTIVRALRHAKQNNGNVKLASLSPKIIEVLDLAGISTLFEIFLSKEEAVESYKN